MSGPNDSGTPDAPADDFKLTPLQFDATPTLSQRFRLRMMWDTPRLEWKPIKGYDAKPDGDTPPQPPPPPPPNPERAFKATERYIIGGGYLFDLHRVDWGPMDRAFQFAPLDPPNYTPSLAEIMAWQDESFYRRLGRTASLSPFDASLSMTPLAPPSLFYKAPNPPPLYGDTPLARPGKVGDALKAAFNLPITQHLKGLAVDELTRQYNSFVGNDWDKWSGWQKATAITFAGLFVAGAVGTVAATDDARHFAAQNFLGVEVPVYLINQRLSVFRVPGTSIKIDGYGSASNFLLGPAADPTKPREFKITIMVDVREAFHVIGTYF
jgi:hypothetical protein